MSRRGFRDGLSSFGPPAAEAVPPEGDKGRQADRLREYRGPSGVLLSNGRLYAHHVVPPGGAPRGAARRLARDGAAVRGRGGGLRRPAVRRRAPAHPQSPRRRGSGPGHVSARVPLGAALRAGDQPARVAVHHPAQHLPQRQTRRRTEPHRGRQPAPRGGCAGRDRSVAGSAARRRRGGCARAGGASAKHNAISPAAKYRSKRLTVTSYSAASMGGASWRPPWFSNLRIASAAAARPRASRKAEAKPCRPTSSSTRSISF